MRAVGRRGCSNGSGCDEVFRRELGALGWELFDVFGVTEALWRFVEAECEQRGGGGGSCKRAWDSAFTDNVHFQCSVYRELNRAFVAALS